MRNTATFLQDTDGTWVNYAPISQGVFCPVYCVCPLRGFARVHGEQQIRPLFMHRNLPAAVRARGWRVEKTSGRGGKGIVGKLDALIGGFSDETAVDWLRERFPSFETGSARKISIGESKGEKDYFASARLLGHITRLPEKSGDTTSNRPLVVVAVEMKGDMTERTSRAGQFAFAKRVLRDAVNAGAMGLDGLPSQGIFFFHDKNGSFRLSLVTGEVEGRRFKFNEAKRQSFYVRPGAANNIIRRRFHDPIKTLSDLKEAFSVEQLTKEFYRELFNWYEWAKDSSASFPNILNEPKDPKKMVL